MLFSIFLCFWKLLEVEMFCFMWLEGLNYLYLYMNQMYGNYGR